MRVYDVLRDGADWSQGHGLVVGIVVYLGTLVVLLKAASYAGFGPVNACSGGLEHAVECMDSPRALIEAGSLLVAYFPATWVYGQLTGGRGTRLLRWELLHTAKIGIVLIAYFGALLGLVWASQVAPYPLDAILGAAAFLTLGLGLLAYARIYRAHTPPYHGSPLPDDYPRPPGDSTIDHDPRDRVCCLDCGESYHPGDHEDCPTCTGQHDGGRADAE